MPTLTSLRKPIVLAAAAAGMLALGVSVARVPDAAEDARIALETAKVAIEAGDAEAAGAAVERARGHVDTVQLGLDGPVGLAGQWIPVLGSSVRDVRHLGDALDAITSGAETGVVGYASVSAEDSTLLVDDTISVSAVDVLATRVGDVQADLTRARESLDEIEGSGPGGERLALARDQALDQVGPLHDGITKALPVVNSLRELIGAEGEQKYLVAMLNPAELRYSGGAPLTIAPLSLDRGKIQLSPAIDTVNSPLAFRRFYWQKVKGNPFHRGRSRLSGANFAPSWPVSGPELLNAYRSLRGRPGVGLIALDVTALADLIDVTGPIEIAPYGELNGDNLVEKLVGSYDEFPDFTRRRGVNNSLIPVFKDRILAEGDLVEKVQSVARSAAGRHLAFYSRDKDAQASLAEAGLAGDLADTDHDYIGAFSQNVTSSKTDYWQRRVVSSRVRLDSDGSARVRLRVEVHNDTTPYVQAEPDPREGYFTRWLTSSVAAFLPRGSEVRSASVDGEPVDFTVGDYFGRPYVRRTIEFAPQARHTFELEYDVPAAAVADDEGGLIYRLDVDPQGMVNPPAYDVRVTWPRGYAVDALPEGWVGAGTSARWRDPGLGTSPSFEVRANRP